MNTAIGKSVQRKDAWDKVTGRAKYTDDFPTTGYLEARLLTSTCAHARIAFIDVSGALGLNGVKAVLTGADCPVLFGPLLQDRPALARDVVRYAGEPVALVVAKDRPTAEMAVRLIRVNYEPLPVILTPSQAMAAGAPLVHDQVNGFKKVLTDIYPEAGTNVASRYRIRKGNMDTAWERCSSIVNQSFFLPPSGHLAMEVRSARAEISADGNVLITTSSQSPYSVRKQLGMHFQFLPERFRSAFRLWAGASGAKRRSLLKYWPF